mmetsp:Transcript_2564/g.7801  ORF Transcript_2564/g.7801 Transcript_2564/m.7801 type:complete len:226 (-) Transcript_2564:237-914(-)
MPSLWPSQPPSSAPPWRALPRSTSRRWEKMLCCMGPSRIAWRLSRLRTAQQMLVSPCGPWAGAGCWHASRRSSTACCCCAARCCGAVSPWPASRRRGAPSARGAGTSRSSLRRRRARSPSVSRSCGGTPCCWQPFCTQTWSASASPSGWSARGGGCRGMETARGTRPPAPTGGRRCARCRSTRASARSSPWRTSACPCHAARLYGGQPAARTRSRLASTGRLGTA